MAHIFGSIWDRFNRNALNDLSKSVEYQGRSIQDLVAKGQLTPTQYATLIQSVNGLISKGNVTFEDIDINKGKLLPKHASEELLSMIAGNAPINAVPADGSITSSKLSNKSVSAQKILSIPSNIVDIVNISGATEVNMFDASRITDNKYVDNSGDILDSSDLILSDFIPVVENETYSVSIGYSSNGGVYDANKQWLSRVPRQWGEELPHTFTLPEQSAYVRLNMKKDAVPNYMMVPGTILPDEYVSYGATIPWLKTKKQVSNDNSDWSNVIWNGLGDSLTHINEHATRYYHHIIKDELGIKEFNNHGSSGSTVGNLTRPMSTRYSTMKAGADLITVFGGVNDYGQSQPLGTPADRTNETYYGGMHVLLSGLIDMYPSAKIGFIGFHHFGGFFSLSQNLLGHKPIDYINATKEVCKFYSIPFLNLYEEGGLYLENTKQKDLYTTDGLHFNNEGQKRLARMIKGFIKSL